MAANALLRLFLRTDLVELGNGDRLGGVWVVAWLGMRSLLFWGAIAFVLGGDRAVLLTPAIALQTCVSGRLAIALGR
jgi:hypothetical protein